MLHNFLSNYIQLVNSAVGGCGACSAYFWSIMLCSLLHEIFLTKLDDFDYCDIVEHLSVWIWVYLYFCLLTFSLSRLINVCTMLGSSKFANVHDLDTITTATFLRMNVAVIAQFPSVDWTQFLGRYLPTSFLPTSHCWTYDVIHNSLYGPC